MDTNTKELIQSVCMKCNPSSIVDTLRKWGRLSEDQLQSIFSGQSGKATKVKRTQSVLRLVLNPEEVELSTEIAGDLELSYIQLHPKKKLWKVFKLIGTRSDFKQDPRVMRSRLIREVQSKWKDGFIYGNMGYYCGAVWLRIHFDTSKRTRKNSLQKAGYNPNNSVFLLHFQGSPYLIISRTRVKETTLLTESLTKVFYADKLSYLQLSDRHLLSLANIALNKNFESSTVQKFKDLDGCENPLLHNDRKRKQADDIFEGDENIVDLNVAEKRERLMQVDHKFGSGSQPTLEKIEYKFSIGFHSGQEVTNLSSDCKTQVEIKGPSVLNGLKQLANRGFMTFPLPKHLTSVQSQQRNNFTIVSSRAKGNKD